MTAAPPPPLLDIDGLRVTFSTRRGPVEALKGVSLSLRPGETLGLVGESGSGKSVTALAVMRLLDRAGRISAGRIRFNGQDVTSLPRGELRPLRGAAMSMIFQNPRAALNPIRTAGLQIADVIRAHEDVSPKAARARALDLLKAVRIRDPELRLDAFPHELSGGMCQRVMIAMAVACEPRLLVADEPTTGLDVTTQKAVMDLVAGLVRDRAMTLVLITHDLGLAAQYCGRIAVMEQGRLVEEGSPDGLFGRPQHPYTRRLVAASPTRTSTLRDLVPESRPLPAPEPRPRPTLARGEGPLLEVQDLSKRFGPGPAAVGGISFRLPRGTSLGVVGESGSGKTTVSRLVCRLLDPSDGAILFEGRDVGGIPSRDFHRDPARRDIQIVFQDAGESLNPRFSAFDSIVEPIRRLEGVRDGRTLRRRAEGLADRTGFSPDLLDRFPHQLSGGQRARVGIARGIAVGPKLLVLDEPTAALDVSVQAGILQLLDRLRREDGLTFLFVSHDLNVVRMLCERTLVMQAGRVVEGGESQALFTAPSTAYTRDLIAAIPHFDPVAASRRGAPVPVA